MPARSGNLVLRGEGPSGRAGLRSRAAEEERSESLTPSVGERRHGREGLCRAMGQPCREDSPALQPWDMRAGGQSVYILGRHFGTPGGSLRRQAVLGGSHRSLQGGLPGAPAPGHEGRQAVGLHGVLGRRAAASLEIGRPGQLSRHSARPPASGTLAAPKPRPCGRGLRAPVRGGSQQPLASSAPARGRRLLLQRLEAPGTHPGHETDMKLPWRRTRESALFFFLIIPHPDQ